MWARLNLAPFVTMQKVVGVVFRDATAQKAFDSFAHDSGRDDLAFLRFFGQLRQQPALLLQAQETRIEQL